MNPLWSWVLTFIGIACFWLAGRKVWWAWFVGIAGQFVWLAYSLLSGQWGFLAGVVLYTVVYVGNAVRWTREHRRKEEDGKDTDDRRVVHGPGQR